MIKFIMNRNKYRYKSKILFIFTSIFKKKGDMKTMITIHAKKDKINVPGDALLVFIDETGNEYLKDKEYPIFGLGGCAVICKDYNKLIREPWSIMKDRFFNGREKILHAKDLFHPTECQINTIAELFKNNIFSRVAAVLSTKTINNTEYDIYNIIARCLYNRIIDIAKWTCFKSVVIMVEDSQRCNALAKKYFPAYGFQEYNKEINKDTKMPSNYYFVKKDLVEPGAEVADFIIHTAGAQMRNRINNKIKSRKDYKIIFEDINEKYSSCMLIDKISKKSTP